LILLSGSFVFGGIIKNGSIGPSNGSNLLQSIIPLAIMIYLGILLTLNYFGLKLKTHEMIVISIILSLIVFMIFNFVFHPRFEVNDSEATSTQDQVITRTSSTVTKSSTGSAITANLTYTIQTQGPEFSTPLLSQVQLFALTTSFIIIVIVLVFIYSRSGVRSTKIRFVEENLYSGNYNKIQATIIAIYVDLSVEVEKQYGRAPNWYSPTHFSDTVEEKAIQSLASEWGILTELYEIARFSKREVNSDDLKNAQDLSQHIQMTLQKIKEGKE